MSNKERWSGVPDVPPVGTVSKTGAVYIGNDQFVSEWVITGAPFKAREANAMSNQWRIDNKHGQLNSLGITEDEAKEYADRLNLQAAHAILVKR